MCKITYVGLCTIIEGEFRRYHLDTIESYPRKSTTKSESLKIPKIRWNAYYIRKTSACDFSKMQLDVNQFILHITKEGKINFSPLYVQIRHLVMHISSQINKSILQLPIQARRLNYVDSNVSGDQLVLWKHCVGITHTPKPLQWCSLWEELLECNAVYK